VAGVTDVIKPYSIIIPVKRVGVGKSRLRASGDAGDELVMAIALDTIAAALAAVRPARSSSSVLVITDDPAVAAAASGLGALVAADSPGAGLNGAIAHGDQLLPQSATRAALTADLPALRPADLAAALAGANGRSFVADHLGTGTTLLIAPPHVPLDPHFGIDSAAAHAASGARALTGGWPSLRLDVDTRADLEAARSLGLGPLTAAALALR
jgi:2-phospho-L-lactate guanylyltransferase